MRNRHLTSNKVIRNLWIPPAIICLLVINSCHVILPKKQDSLSESLLSQNHPKLVTDTSEFDNQSTHDGARITNHLLVQFGDDIPSSPKQRIIELLKMRATVSVVNDETLNIEEKISVNNYDAVLLFGDTTLTRALVSDQGIKNLPSEGFIVSKSTVGIGIPMIAVVGQTQTDKRLLDQKDTANHYSIGSLYGAYDLLEQLGYRFLHPLEPHIPDAINVLQVEEKTESPHWPIRAWHLHTQHPIELTHVLNGWGEQGPNDKANWQQLTHEWQSFLEWAIANKQNRIAWFLLQAESWQAFAYSEERQSRLRQLSHQAHDWLLTVGIDAPIAFKQQHAWHMIREKGNEQQQIRTAIDWLAKTDIDYLEIELGFSEFTHPDENQMLQWIDTAVNYADTQYNLPLYSKVHCTQNQQANTLQHPQTGEPLNINFLTYFTDTRLGVMPHTVQFYDLQGPAPTYGNDNFQFMDEYMELEAGRREVLFYPETAYWVSFDIDVPLFLPLYADRRLADIRHIARKELTGGYGVGKHQGSKIDGYNTFSSGWEWGYWINDMVTARATWNPQLDTDTQEQAMQNALQPFTSIFGEAQSEISSVLTDLIQLQRNRFIHSDSRRSAQAYLQGWEAWDELTHLLGIMEIQPKKLSSSVLARLINPRDGLDYDKDIAPMLKDTAIQLAHLHKRLLMTQHHIPANSRGYFNELADNLAITALRAEQIYHLYEYADEKSDHLWDQHRIFSKQHKQQAIAALDFAKTVSARQQQRYRVNPDRIASWGHNPTAYQFGYLWTVNSLYYWWRDEQKILNDAPLIGFANILDPIDLAHGESEWHEEILGIRLNLSQMRSWLSKGSSDSSGFLSLLNEPIKEPILNR